MARITVEGCLAHVNNRFALVLLATMRAKQLLTGAPPALDHKGNKLVVGALREIEGGAVRRMTPEEIRQEDEDFARAAQERAAARSIVVEKTTSEELSVNGHSNGTSANGSNHHEAGEVIAEKVKVNSEEE